MLRDNPIVIQFANGLKSRSQQGKASRELLLYVKTELREMPQDESQAFLDEFNHHIIEMISSNDVVEKKGGVLAIKCLIHGDTVNTTTSISRYLNQLRCLFPCSDVAVMEIAARTLVTLGQLPGSKGAESFEYEIKKAFEFISEDRNDGKRHAAVIILRELAVANATFFYQQVSSFFDNIFIAIRDPKHTIRDCAGEALRAALIVTSQRENVKSAVKPQWYKICYEEAMYCFNEGTSKDKGCSRDDRVHGALIILNEILRCSNAIWEKKYLNLKRLHPEQSKQIEDSSNIFPRLKNQLSDKFGNSSNRNSKNFPDSSYVFDFDTDSKFSRQSLSINESATCRQIIFENYEEICEKVLQQRHLKTSFVQKSLLNILPRLAAFNRDEFVSRHLRTIIDFLLSTLRNKEKDQNITFVTLGFIAVAVGKSMQQEHYIGRIMEVIKASMPSKDTTKKKLTPIDPSVFKCITLLGHAVQNGISKDVKDILEPMFSTGLTSGLTICLRELANNIPDIKREISDLLLKMLTQVLLTKPQPQHGTPKHNITAQIAALTVSVDSQPDIAVIVLALKTLGTFQFEGQNLLPFVQRCADDFLTNEHQEIRIEAVQTCSSLLKTSIQQSMDSGGVSDTLKETICHVLEKLLIAGVTDIDSNVRLRVLKSLDETFDAQLAQPWFLSSLLVTLNDEVFEIRELAIITIGRLSSMNPAYVMPSLRKTLVQLLTELEHSGMSRNKEQSARMLDHLILNTPRLISAYMRPILTILVPKLKEPEGNPAVILNILQAIGDLAEVTGGSSVMEFYAEDLLAILLEMLNDSGSPNKRRIALWSLGQLVSSTGQVVSPYNKYPQLIDILINFLKSDTDLKTRRETIRVLGLLGALDPYKHKLNRGLVDNQNDSILISYSDIKIDEHNDLSTAELLVNMNNALDEFYPAVAISTLMKILRDPNLSHHHMAVVQAVTFIFRNLGIKCVPYLPQVLPSLINNIRGAEVNSRDFLFTQLSNIIEIVQQHIMKYMDEIFKLVKEFWIPTSEPIQLTLINLVEKISISLGCEFRVYLSELMPQILKVLSHDNSRNRSVTIQLLSTIQKFGDNLDDYLHLILPPIVKLFDPNDIPQNVCIKALETVNFLAEILDFTDYSSRIIHALVRVLDNYSDLRGPAMATLCSLMIQLGRGYLIFVPLVNKILQKHKINNLDYMKILVKIQSPTTLPLDDEFRLRQARYKNRELTTIIAPDTTIKKLPIQENRLQVQSLRRVSKDDWLEWLKTLSIGLIKESQSPALRACQSLAQNYPPLLRDLFNAAFISCWTELSAEKRNQLAESFKQALMVPDLPEITQVILNLAEFMEHCEKQNLTIDAKSLGERAMECRAFAKALHYKEVEFREEKSHQVIESLILINNKLQQKEAAEGLLGYVMAHPELEIQVRWYEKLHNWERALGLYEEKLKKVGDDAECYLGQMRCLEALGEWSELSELCNNKWEALGSDGQSKAGRLAAVASWGLQDFDKMSEYVKCIPEDTQDGSFYRAVLAVHSGNYQECQNLIDHTRYLLDTELTAMASESYERAYGAMVCVQMLAELEEVITYKLIPERRENIKEMWWKRLRGGQRLVEDWQRIIQVHSLVVSPQEDVHTWLKYASLCRKSKQLKLSHKTLVMLLGSDPSLAPENDLPYHNPHVTFAYTKHLYMDGKEQLAYDKLSRFVNIFKSTVSQKSSVISPAQVDTNNRLLARCFMKLGLWMNKLQGLNEGSINNILSYYEAATKYDKESYKAWHSWAYANFKVIQTQRLALLQKSDSNSGASGSTSANETAKKERENQLVLQYAVPALKGFFRSINLSQGNSLQDTLRLLTLWFDYGQTAEVIDALNEGIRIIEINTWLQVIPQLIARIDTPRLLVGQLIHKLLSDIGKSHPQALVYPLTVASKSASLTRKNAANIILNSMKEHSPTLVEQAKMISEELIRVAILWHEQWHEGLEEASRLYFADKDIKGMFEILSPLHAMLERGPQTLKETSFNQAYGRELSDANEWCNSYKASQNPRDLSQAWDLYYHVFRRISKQLPQLTSLELQYVSPKLLKCRDLELAVPGSYTPGQELIRIASIQTNLQVITSKQRPRKLCIHGSNGKEYMFLLKGHEDLRQDERVMQLFGLVNTLLLNDPDTFRRNLTIQRYAVIPLSTNSGLIGWVPHCDTLHVLIRDYREKQKTLINIEHRLMLRMAPDYEKLTLMQKVEVFEYALGLTKGDDLARLLWLKSPSSEVWFERRTNYTRSLATMSMVGYILGLGDRHPSNLMLDRLTGKILHIDFGDCFEVAMTREKFPEKIPFRLTRMLTNAMEVTGIEGTYQKTCVSVMNVLRKNKDSLMAVLEAFVYDPLLNWRLLDTTEKSRRSKTLDIGGVESLAESADDTSSDILSFAGNQRSATQRQHSENAIENAQSYLHPAEATNKKARMIVDRVKQKLTGSDFHTNEPIDVEKQVELLIQQATNNENLCQNYIGWCPFW